MRLTRSQLRCVQLAGDGLSDKEIALRLQISHRTVQDHMQAAYRRLGVTDRWAAVEAARTKYGEVPVPISSEAGRTPDRSGDAISIDGPRQSDGPISALLMTAYFALYRVGRPRRAAGSLLPMILVWSLLGLILLGTVLVLANALIGSANELAARAYAT